MKKVYSALTNMAKEVRGIIVQMQGIYYPKPWAVKIVTKYSKNTTKRGGAIREMVKNRRIPKTGARLLRNIVKQEDKKVFFVHDA